jgi:hypothetical protein
MPTPPCEARKLHNPPILGYTNRKTAIIQSLFVTHSSCQSAFGWRLAVHHSHHSWSATLYLGFALCALVLPTVSVVLIVARPTVALGPIGKLATSDPSNLTPPGAVGLAGDKPVALLAIGSIVHQTAFVTERRCLSKRDHSHGSGVAKGPVWHEKSWCIRNQPVGPGVVGPGVGNYAENTWILG